MSEEKNNSVEEIKKELVKQHEEEIKQEEKEESSQKYHGEHIQLKGIEDNGWDACDSAFDNRDNLKTISELISKMNAIISHTRNGRKEISKEVVVDFIDGITKYLNQYIINQEAMIQEFANHIRLLMKDDDGYYQSLETLCGYRLLERLDYLYDELAPFVVEKHIDFRSAKQ